MRSARRAVLLAAAVLAAPAPALADGSEVRTTHATAMGRMPSGPANLIVTFADRPAQAEVVERLGDLGAVASVVPEIGVWQVTPTSPATARRVALRRAQVQRADWSTRRTLDVFPSPSGPVPTNPLQTLPDPTDPYYLAPIGGQWGLRRGTWSPGLAAYDRPTIAILDSGVDSTHEEWRTPGLLIAPRSTVTGVNSAEDISQNGHGTHVAGIAAAPMNGIGVVGVAPASATSPDPAISHVIPVQITNAAGESDNGTMMRGIRWAVTHGAKVINISSGGEGYDQAFQDTINWAYKQGALIVASVGNEAFLDNPVNFPAAFDHVVGVSAQCDGTAAPPDCPTPFGRARFSNTNFSVDVMAPGVQIPSTIPLAVTRQQIAPGYGFNEGTSMASPYVAGAAALVYAAHPGITPFQVIRLLESTASRAAAGQPRTSSEGWGVVNPLAAAQAPVPPDDIAEPNDDVKFLPKNQTILLNGRTPFKIDAWADFNDDQFDTYAVNLRKGQRLKVTLNAEKGRLGAIVYRPGTSSISPRIRKVEQLRARELGETQRPTPGARAVVVTARESGRHIISVLSVAGGGYYSLKLQRL